MMQLRSQVWRFVGIGLFPSLTALLAAWVVGDRYQEETQES